MKIIDTFPFHGDWVVKMRLEFLSPYVDEFVIVESWYTFSGEKKEFLYKDKWEDFLKPYQSKIHWIIIDQYPPMTDKWHNAYKDHPLFQEEKKQAWFNEHYHRDVAVHYINEKYADEDCMVNVGDVQEIPNIDIFHPNVKEDMLRKLDEIQKPLHLEMVNYYYNFYWKKPYHWFRAYIVSKKQLMETPSLSYWRFIPSLVLRDAGWRFHYFMEIRDIQKRILHSLHDEKWADTDHIKECIAQGKDIFNRDGQEALIHDEKPSAFPETFGPFQGEIDYIQLS